MTNCIELISHLVLFCPTLFAGVFTVLPTSLRLLDGCLPSLPAVFRTGTWRESMIALRKHELCSSRAEVLRIYEETATIIALRRIGARTAVPCPCAVNIMMITNVVWWYYPFWSEVWRTVYRCFTNFFCLPLLIPRDILPCVSSLDISFGVWYP